MKTTYKDMVRWLLKYRIQYGLDRSTMAYFCGLSLEGWMDLEEGRTMYKSMLHNDSFWEAMLVEFEISKHDIESKEFQLILKI